MSKMMSYKRPVYTGHHTEGKFFYDQLLGGSAPELYAAYFMIFFAEPDKAILGLYFPKATMWGEGEVHAVMILCLAMYPKP